MKKKLTLALILILFAVLLIPLPSGTYKDGGTREYSALTYKIVSWNRINADKIYTETDFYLFPDNFKSIDTLWSEKEIPESFLASIVEFSGYTVTVKPLENQPITKSADLITFSMQELDNIGAFAGEIIEVYYSGEVMESYPAQIKALSWKKPENTKETPYPLQWLNKEAAEKLDTTPLSDIVITQIFSDCFIASPVIPLPYTIKINCTLSDEWCVGDQVICTLENIYDDRESYRYEGDLLTIEASDFTPDPNVCYKPVVYLYPERETDVTVNMELNGQLTCTYPAYKDGWRVKAKPDGTLTDLSGKEYNYLYWEGDIFTEYDFSKGFCVSGEDTAEFLEIALEKLGLNRREANEFIVYWLPLMQNNPYNIIAFQAEAYTDAAVLKVSPAPDTEIRVFMTWKASDFFTQIQPQQLTAPERKGFTLVEWGGAEIK